MKKTKKYIAGLLVLSASLFTSCDNDFKNINKSPATVYEVDPVSFLYNIQTQASTAGTTWTESYACKLRWMQYCSGIWGYNTNNYTDLGLGGSYGEYNTMGSYARHIPYYIEQNMPDQLENYTLLIEVANIMLISKGIQASDTYGSLVYTEGWGTRSGREDLIEPVFETQEELYDIWNKELKETINKLKSATNQVSIKNYDMAYSGDADKWVKAANSLRMRMALRLLKRDPAKAKSIASEVLSSGEYFNGIEDSFILYFDNYWTTQGDWHSVIDMDRAAAPFMNYLKKYDDPRKRLFFQINNLTPDNITKYNSEQTDDNKKMPETLTRWEGGTVSYDFRATDQNYLSRYLADGTDMRAMNRPQTRLWKGAQDNGTAGGWVPVVTYADFCFMAAEFTLEGVNSSKTAQAWYEEGIRASLEQWSEIGKYCQINDYKAVTEDEIDTFLAQEGIAWNPAIAKEQIYCQSWVEHFKNNNESWALWRRTGYPNTLSTVVTFDPVMVLSQVQDIPRRKKFTYPAEGSANYANQVARLKKMEEDPDFGDVNSEFGRIWWDKK